jgi:hypothetical protein
MHVWSKRLNLGIWEQLVWLQNQAAFALLAGSALVNAFNLMKRLSSIVRANLKSILHHDRHWKVAVTLA